MGSGNARMQKDGIEDYGVPYGIYPNSYSPLENYGSAYQPFEDDFESFNSPGYPAMLVTTKPRRNRVQPNGLNRYGAPYPPGFNPMFPFLLDKPRVRTVFVPQAVFNVLQNLFQQGAFAGLDSFLPGLGVFSPRQPMPGIPGGMPGVMGGMPMGSPMFYGGGAPMFPQMPYGVPNFGSLPYGNPLMPQAPVFPMGSNCFSVSLQLPSMPSQYSMPMPCPPPMIQPVVIPMAPPYPPMVPQFPAPPVPPPPMVYPQVFPSVPAPSPIPFAPQMIPPSYPSPFIPSMPQQQPSVMYPPPMIPGSGLGQYGGYSQFPLNYPSMNPMFYGQPSGLGVYSGPCPSPYAGAQMPSGYMPMGPANYPIIYPGIPSPSAVPSFQYPNVPGCVPQSPPGVCFNPTFGNYINPGHVGYPVQPPYGPYGQQGNFGFNNVVPSPSGFSPSSCATYSDRPIYNPAFMPFYPPGFGGAPGPAAYPPQLYPGLGAYGGPGYHPGCTPSPYGHFYPFGSPNPMGQGMCISNGLPSYGVQGPMSIGGQTYLPNYYQGAFLPYSHLPSFAGSQGQVLPGQQNFPVYPGYPGYPVSSAQNCLGGSVPSVGYPGMGYGPQGQPNGPFPWTNPPSSPPAYPGFNWNMQNIPGFTPNNQQGVPGYGFYSQQQVPAVQYPVYGVNPTVNQQPAGFSNYPSPPINPFPGGNINIPCAYSPANNIPGMNNSPFGSYPGRTGRITLVCCAIPE